MMQKIILLLAILGFLFCFSPQGLAKPEETLVVAMEADTDSMDPLQASMTYAMVMMRQIYDTLIDFGPNGELNPRLATSWRWLDDLTMRFNLRKGVKFHNGYPFTAADVKFSMERILDPNNRCRYLDRYSGFDKFNIVDDYTIDLKIKEPDALVPHRMAFFGRIVSKRWVEENGVERLRKQAMGTGPFKFVSWNPKERLVLEANAGHFMDVPKIKRVIFRPIPEMAARVAELQAGGAHIITNVPPFIINQLEKDKDLAVQTIPAFRAYFMIINTLTVPELRDKRVRQALNYAVDKETIIKKILNGMGTPLGVNAPSYLPGVDPSIKPYPYNPEKAKALLKEAGYPNGFELNVYSPSGRYTMDKEVVQAVADQLSKIGIKTNLFVWETQKYFTIINSKEGAPGISFGGHGLLMWDQDPMVIFVDPKAAWCRYHHPDMEKLIRKMRSYVDNGPRFEVAHQIQRIIHEEAALLFLYSEENIYGLSRRVQGFKARSDDTMDLWNVSLAD